MNAVMPRLPFDLLVTAITTMRSPVRPCVMNCLVPLMTQQSPSRTADERIAPASLPADASVSPHAASFSPRRERHEVRALLFVGSEHRDVRGAQPVVRGDGQRDRRIDARELLDADAVVDRRHRRAAEFFRELNAHQSERGELREQLAWELLRLVPLARVRPQLGFGEFADAAPQQLLIGVNSKFIGAFRSYHSDHATRRLLPLIGLVLAVSSRPAFADATLFLGDDHDTDQLTQRPRVCRRRRPA